MVNGWLEFFGTRTCSFICSKGTPKRSPRVADLRRKMLARRDELLTSFLTIGEVIAKPKQLGNVMLEKRYLNFFSSGSIELVAFGMDAAKQYADIRSRQRIRPADAPTSLCFRGG